MTRLPSLAFALAGALLAVAVVPDGAGAQDPERNLVEAVVDAFPKGDRQIYISPTLVMTRRSPNMRGNPRHDDADLEEARARFDAKIMKPEEAIECADPSDPESCRIPGNGLIVQFLLPNPRQEGRLPLQVVVFYDGKGEKGGIRREMWRMIAAEQPGMGWIILRKEMVATAEGPA